MSVQVRLAAALLLVGLGSAQAQVGAPGMPPLARPLSTPQEVPAAHEARAEGGSLSLRASASPQGEPVSAPRARTERVDTSSQPVPAGLAAAALNEKVDLDPRPEIAAQDLRAQVASQQSRLVPNRGPAGELTLQPGRNEVLQIARSHLNRFVTPFANPIVKTTAAATTTSAEGSIVYLATAGSEPVSLFIIDGDSPENALTLTLIPRDVPAVSVSLKLDGYLATGAASNQEAERYEAADSFVATIRETFKMLAQGEIPPGYGMRQIRGYNPNMPECVLPGLRTQPAQEIAGSSVLVVVAKVTNISNVPKSIDESRCASDRVLAVAAWPYVDLMPGQASELFIAVRRDAAPSNSTRPSVL